MKILIIGAGDVGSYIAKDLSQTEDVVIVDTDPKALERVEENTDVMTMRGNGTYRKTLTEVGVQTADLVLGVTSDDSTNLVIASLAQNMGAKRSLARVDAPDFFQTNSGIERNVLGAFAILCASRLVSTELLRLVRKIDMPFVETFASNSISVALIDVTESFRYLDKAPSDIDLGKGAAIIGILRDDELLLPSNTLHLHKGDKILISAPLEKLPVAHRRLAQLPDKRAIIIGGGDVGFQLAKSLQDVENRLTIIDIDRRRCEFLADNLDHATIVHGDGTSLALLQNEHVEAADYTLAVTKADEVNLMSSLVGREVGVRNCYTLVHRPGYATVYEHLGIKGNASSHELISKAVNKFFPHRIVLSEAPITGTDYMVCEMQVAFDVKKVNTKLRDLKIPPTCHLIGISHNEVFSLGDLDTEINAGDSVILVCKKNEIKTLENIFYKMN